MTCAEYQRWFSPYLDGLLQLADRATLEEHLKSCPHCRSDLASLREMLRSLRTMEPPTVPNLLPGIHQKLAATPWWATLGQRFLAPWPVSLPLHSLALATTAFLVVVLVESPMFFREHPKAQRQIVALLDQNRDAQSNGRIAFSAHRDASSFKAKTANERSAGEPMSWQSASRPLPTVSESAAVAPGKREALGVSHEAFRSAGDRSAMLATSGSKDARLQGAGLMGNARAYAQVTGREGNDIVADAVSDQEENKKSNLPRADAPVQPAEPSAPPQAVSASVSVTATLTRADHDAQTPRQGDETVLLEKTPKEENLKSARHAESPASALQVTIASDRSVYEAAAPIRIHMTLTNASSERLHLVDLRQVGRELAFAAQILTVDVSNRTGQSQRIVGQCGAMVDHFPGEKTSWLNPRESIEFSFVVNEPCSEESKTSYPTDFPGAYQLAIVYDGLIVPNPFSEHPPTIVKTQRSNTISIAVAPSHQP